MKFVITSLPRCGSTAIYRILNSDPGANIAYEPGFFDVGLDLNKVRKKTINYFSKSCGMKHIWDPNGWPFRNPNHISSVDVLGNSHELILPNKTVLDCADKIVFLRRKNTFDRTLSDLWGQQTSLWGHAPHRPYDASEVQRYRDAACRRVPSAIDPDVFGWYMHNANAWENAIIGDLPSSTVKTTFYEDLFDHNIPQNRLLDAWQELAEWLDIKPDFWSCENQQIISRSSKLNSVEIYEQIPNYHKLKADFSSYSSGKYK